MADRTVSVTMRARVTDYVTNVSAAGKATTDLGNKVAGTSQKSAQGLQNLGRGMVVAGGAMVAAFGAAEMAAMKFDKEMSNVAAVSDASAKQMGQLREAALLAGKATVFSASQSAEAEAELAKAGVSVKDILGGALLGSLNLASAGQLQLADAATIAAQAMNIFKLGGKDVSHIADVLAAGANKSAADVSDLGLAMQQSGLVAAQTGMSFEDTVGVLSAFADRALRGSDAGTSLKTMLQRLTPQSQQAQQMMDQLGISAYDASGNFVGLANFAQNLQDSLGGLTPQARNAALALIFGTDAVRAANVLYELGAKGVRDYTQAVNDQGAAQRMAAKQLDNLAGDVEQFKGSLETALIQSGSKANGVLRDMTQLATGAVNAYLGMPGPVQATAIAVVGLGGALTVVAGGLLLIAPRAAAANVALKEMSGGAWSLGGALKGLGKGLGIAGLAFAAYEGIKALHDAVEDAGPSVDRLTTSLVRFGRQGVANGELTRAFGSEMKDFSSELKRIADPTTGQRVIDVLGRIGSLGMEAGAKWEEANKDFKAVDQALANMVTGGNADVAADAFKNLAIRANFAGISTAKLKELFPAYQAALDSAAAQTAVTGGKVDGLASAQDGLAASTSKATDAMKQQNDMLHAMADPVFAMHKALVDWHDAQDQLNQAIKDHGAASVDARQAEVDLATAALGVTDAANTLSGALDDGTTSANAMSAQLSRWVAQGLLTEAQANRVASALGADISKARELDGVDAKPKVNVSGADAAKRQIDEVLHKLALANGATADVYVRGHTIGLPSGGFLIAGTGVQGQATGGYAEGRYSLVGEQGPELIDWARRFVYTAPQTQSMLSGASGGSRGGLTIQNYNVYAAPGEPVGQTEPRGLRQMVRALGI